MSKIWLSEDSVFHSLQGEGPTIGEPAVFVRLQGCNLRCNFCDSLYAVEGKGIPSMQVEDLVSMIKVLGGSICRRLVITGGEVLLQSEAVEELINYLGQGWYIEVETNGTIVPKPWLYVHQVNCSPKLSNSGMPISQRINPEALTKFAQNPNCYFKFVVQNKEDLQEVLELVQEYHIYRHMVIIMPEGVEHNRIIGTAREIAPEVIKLGFRLLPRLHIMLWGNKRGV